MFDAAISPAPPAATPGGRARGNEPVTNTVSPTIAWLHTTPLICHVGSASAETVAGGGAGAAAVVAAAAVGSGASTAEATSAVKTATSMLMPRRRREGV